MLPTTTRGTSALAAAFTIYWTPQGWKGVTENHPLYGAAGTGFEGKISPGDRVFITNVLAGKLRLQSVMGSLARRAALSGALPVRLRMRCLMLYKASLYAPVAAAFAA